MNGGTFEIASGDDAFHADDTLTVTAGTINITESYEGLEGLHVVISGGDIALVASDDGLNAAGGTDSSGSGGRDGMFGGPGSSSSSMGLSSSPAVPLPLPHTATASTQTAR
ncbi:MAG: carbohydrate-binding domain-containing protein [Bianqueaceae bacterium]